MRGLRPKPERSSQPASSREAAGQHPTSPAEKLQRGIGNQGVLPRPLAKSDGHILQAKLAMNCRDHGRPSCGTSEPHVGAAGGCAAQVRLP